MHLSSSQTCLGLQVPDRVLLAKSHLAVDDKGDVRLMILGTSAEVRCCVDGLSASAAVLGRLPGVPP